MAAGARAVSPRAPPKAGPAAPEAASAVVAAPAAGGPAAAGEGGDAGPLSQAAAATGLVDAAARQAVSPATVQTPAARVASDLDVAVWPEPGAGGVVVAAAASRPTGATPSAVFAAELQEVGPRLALGKRSCVTRPSVMVEGRTTVGLSASSESGAAPLLSVICEYCDVAEAVPGRVSEVSSGLAAGVVCHVLAGFVVSCAAGACRPEPRAEAMLCACCRACGHRFPWSADAFPDGPREAKRRRSGLPCGHFAFACRWQGSLELRDVQDRAQTLVVHFSDESGELFGVHPEEAARDRAALRRAEDLLEALLRDGRRTAPPPEPWNQLAAIHVATAGPFGGYIVE
eukprot:CAMPEP_0175587938 /NCGR_PEP_ID=MMETSP0096-20121207/51026_1 /TAXON_ID=311494 /ORGANISM="Alexandrium monilatum, Strain CCMP3105" /LENGTH=343 /DNA_ID=CAMNT_0016891889 /DNA_START=1 /DNA_END=1029 /DNA_ORIENTATION=+